MFGPLLTGALRVASILPGATAYVPIVATILRTGWTIEVTDVHAAAIAHDEDVMFLILPIALPNSQQVPGHFALSPS